MRQFHKALILPILLALTYWTNAKSNTFRGEHPHHETETRIIDGHPVYPHSVKSIVALSMYNQKTGNSTSCGGSLISDRHILTAAHCVHGTVVFRAQFGAHNRSRQEPDQTVVNDVRSFTYSEHYDYSIATDSHDIAIIKLWKPLDLSKVPHVEIAKLPEAKNAGKTYLNEVVQIYGWGLVNDNPEERAKELMGVNVTVIDNQICRNQLKKASPFPSNLYDYEICTGGSGPHGSIGACHGDSGGPLFSNGTLIGVVSRGASGSCTNREPTVFVSVGRHLGWINLIMNHF